MEVLTFPQPMVNYLNALYAGLQLDEARQQLAQHLQTTARWLKEQTPLLVGAEEELAANQLQVVGRELAAALKCMQAGAYDAVEQLCTEYSLALACFQRLRQRLRFVDFCEIDQLMQWVVAVSQNRAPRSALIARLEESVSLVDGLRLQMEACRELLPRPVSQALNHGLGMVGQGFEEIRQGAGDIRRGLLLLRNGCQLLAYFVRWRWQETGWSSPFADNPLWRRLNSLAFEGRRPDAQELGELARQDRQKRLLPAQVHENLWSEWEARLRLLPADPAGLDDLLGLVEEMHVQTLDPGQGFSTFLENLLLAAGGVWNGGLPDSLLARELWALFPRAVDHVLQGLLAARAYLDGGDRETLRAALEILLQCAQENRRPQVVLGGLRCRCCQQYFNPEDANDRCLGQGVHQYLQVCA